MKVNSRTVLLALALSSALLAVASAAGTRKLLAAKSAESAKKTESAKHFGGGWGGGFSDWGHPSYPHYDYHPAEYVPHGDHYHYVPSHFDYDAFGKRKLLSTEPATETKAAEATGSPSAVQAADATHAPAAVKAVESVKKTESAQKTDAAQHGGWGGHPSYPHYDYHAASFVPHGDHYHYVPSHYDFDAFGKRKLLSTETVKTTTDAAAAKSPKSTESAQKSEQWGTHHGYQFTDDPYQYSHGSSFGYHTPGTIPAYGGFGGFGGFGRRKMLATETADTADKRTATAHKKTFKGVKATTGKPEAAAKKDQYGTDHEYQFTDDPYQYTSRYVTHPEEVVQHGDHVHVVPEHQDWYDADANSHTPGTIPLSQYNGGWGRKLMADEAVDSTQTAQKTDGVKTAEKAEKKEQYGEYMAYHGAEYVPHGDHVHYVPEHRDLVYGTQVAPGVIIPGAPGNVMPAWGRKLMAAESVKVADAAKATEATKKADTTKAIKKVEKAQQYGTDHGYQFTDEPYQNTPHYDYHQGEYVQHGDHMHYVPGHYDYHDPRYTNGGDHDHDHDDGYNNGYNGDAGSQLGGMIGGLIGGLVGR